MLNLCGLHPQMINSPRSNRSPETGHQSTQDHMPFCILFQWILWIQVDQEWQSLTSWFINPSKYRHKQNLDISQYVYLRRGDTKGSCVTGDAGDHSVRKPTCDRALFCSGRAWNWTFIAERRDLDPKRGHPTIAMVAHHLVYLKSHLEVYCLTHASCREKKNTVSVSTNPKVAFAVPMDARTCHFHRTVGYVANGCRKIRIASRMMMMMRMMTMMLMMRHCEGAAAWRDAQGMWRVFTWGGHGSGHSEQSGRDLDPKREHPTMSMVAHHLVHLNSHLEVYIVNCQTHTSCGEKKHGQC